MKKRNLVSLLLIGVLTATSLLSCGSSGNTASNNSKSEQSSTTSSDDLLAQIKSSGTLKIGTEGTYAPYTYHNDKNELVGYDVEVGQAIAKELGVKAEFIETPWDSCIAGLDAKRYDVVMNQVGITDERKEKYDFSTPYTVTRAVLIVGKDNNDIKSFNDLKGKKAAQGLTSNFADMAKKYGADLVDTDGQFSKSIDLIASGRADATINDDVAFYDYLKQKPDAPLKIADTLNEASNNAVLIRKGNDSFVNAVNDALAKLDKDGTLKNISEKYFGNDVTK
ncbi:MULTISPECIES: amino acid ABC transporter substrate-binding protein [unclassified Clostridium]|uniref:amino acid ABC transporter substrate-binding protein n=1 Tax=unclassified Clostridium TaxID=2614128 RepID=UPI00023B08BD|nr:MULTISPECIES: amino acid ABC transporter substrate-binding protein [unclassified Clostridium]EHJ02231.1 ABC-type transporter, periplasmic subunit family 3 [Clostridium sp. DL-VIII]OOM81241.1 L-cystine-binding protein TcyA precursor [Clostridium sp. BL-8]